MGIKLKDGVNLEVLRKYGFKTGKEYADAGERCLEGIGYEYQHGWYHKFLTCEEDPNKIVYADEENDIPMVQISVRTEAKFFNDVYVDCAPCYTYHIGGYDMDIVLETIFEMTRDGILERY